ncbi:MAG TPA: hypothetical protein VN739_00125, partial [Nitrososphaerales archaeon]|nr:hypothetical protein [Nitrososphaerales archaeon]
MNSANAGAKTILSTCAGLREGESLLIAADSDIDSVTREISNLAEEIGGQVTNLKIHGPVSREPPENIAR